MTYQELTLYGDLVEGTDFLVVTIHPRADETDELQRLGIASDTITVCDWYWFYDDVLFFVSVEYAVEHVPQIVVFKKPHTKNGYCFHIITHHTPIDHALMNHLLAHLATWIRAHHLPQLVRNGRSYTLLDGDIAQRSYVYSPHT